jgi:hypothetical protein
MTKAHTAADAKAPEKSLRYPPINEASPINEAPGPSRLTQRLLCVTEAGLFC